MKTAIVLAAPSLLLVAALGGVLAGAWAAALLGWRSVGALLMVLVMAILSACAFGWTLPYWYPPSWLAAQPAGSPSAAEQAIIFGFGYELSQGRISPDPIHRALLHWTLTRTKASTILAQEAVFVAALHSGWSPSPNDVNELIHQAHPGRVIRRFHRHSPAQYVSTAEAVLCALPLLDSGKPAVLVAHPDHLARVAYNARLLAPERDWIVAGMPAVGYSASSVHRHTRSPEMWRRYEVLGARPRDVFASLPNECRMPL